MNLGDIIEVHCDLDGQPVNDPKNYSSTIIRKFKVIGRHKYHDQFLIEMHYNSYFGTVASRLNLKDFELLHHIDSTDLQLIKLGLINSISIVTSYSLKNSKDSGGASCLHCDNYYPYISSNRLDGKFLCYFCRTSIGYRYPDLTR